MNRSSSSPHELLFENLHIAYVNLICYHYSLNSIRYSSMEDDMRTTIHVIWCIIVHKNYLKGWYREVHCYVFVVILRQSVNKELSERTAKKTADIAKTTRNVM